jgi:hypothetical protein
MATERDAIDQDSQGLDQEQGLEPQAEQYVPMDMWNQAQATIRNQGSQLANATREIRGLQGTIDKALNESRRQNAELRKMVQASNQKNLLDKVPEEMQEWAYEFMQQNQPQQPQETQTAYQPIQQQDTSQQWTQEDYDRLSAHVRSFDLDPTDPRIDTSPLMRTDISQEESLRLFNRHLRTIAPAVNNAPPPQPQANQGSRSQQQQPRQTTNPPTNNVPPATTGANGFGSYDELADAWISGQISEDQFEQGKVRFPQGR